MHNLRIAATGAGLAAMLPLFLLLTDTSTGAADLETMVRLHQHPAFPLRVALTALYFPAVLLSHFALAWSSHQVWAWWGFSLFAIGNGIDAVYRAVQFGVVHYRWCAAWLEATDPGVRESLEVRITAFGEVGAGVYIAFAMFFGLGRLSLGAATVSAPVRSTKILGLSFIVVGALNVLPWIGRITGLPWLAGLGGYYLVPWLVNLLLLAAVLWRWPAPAGADSSLTAG
ncbi:MAG: hypothetical protein B7733_23415 [Myxococcales bacterium FL481]|nr:MAG: hypothetical protein B7733_23415 [Myxococcales bacterium FL481]